MGAGMGAVLGAAIAFCGEGAGARLAATTGAAGAGRAGRSIPGASVTSRWCVDR